MHRREAVTESAQPRARSVELVTTGIGDERHRPVPWNTAVRELQSSPALPALSQRPRRQRTSMVVSRARLRLVVGPALLVQSGNRLVTCERTVAPGDAPHASSTGTSREQRERARASASRVRAEAERAAPELDYRGLAASEHVDHAPSSSARKKPRRAPRRSAIDVPARSRRRVDETGAPRRSATLGRGRLPGAHEADERECRSSASATRRCARGTPVRAHEVIERIAAELLPGRPASSHATAASATTASASTAWTSLRSTRASPARRSPGRPSRRAHQRRNGFIAPR